LSHDQRPGKIRVVRDATLTNGTRSGDPAGVAGRANTNPVNTAGGASGASARGRTAQAQGGAAGRTLPLLPAGIFLLACVIGGVVAVIVRSF